MIMKEDKKFSNKIENDIRDISFLIEILNIKIIYLEIRNLFLEQKI